MRLHSNASGRLRRLVLGTTIAAVLAVTLAACSSKTPGGTIKHVAATGPAAVSHAATTPAASTPAAPSGLSGKWSGHYSGAYQGTFALNWRQSGTKLHGTIRLSAPSNTLPINGTVNGNAIRFGTVGSTAISYTGTVSGNSMSGTYKVQTANGSVGGPWSASRS